jgi:hypothetical protein
MRRHVRGLAPCCTRASPQSVRLDLPCRRRAVGAYPVATSICPHPLALVVLDPAPCSREPVSALAVPVPPATCSRKPLAAVLLGFPLVWMSSLRVCVLTSPPPRACARVIIPSDCGGVSGIGGGVSGNGGYPPGNGVSLFGNSVPRTGSYVPRSAFLSSSSSCPRSTSGSS